MSSISPAIKPNYFAQIDALRAIAVSMVIYSHWAGYHNLWNDDVYWFNGEIGVQLFFVLSGFLITGILLDAREYAKSARLESAHLLKPFYIRRFLRIFPVFYATLALTFIVGHPDVRQSLIWHVTYLSNFFFAIRGEYLGDVSHFWSLAVEEQFYFIWPFIILFVSKRYLFQVVVICMCLAPLFRYTAAFIWGSNEVTVNVIPVSSLDTLAGGSLLAVMKRGYGRAYRGGSILKNLPWISLASGCSYIALRSFIAIPDGYEAIALFIARMLLVVTLIGIVLVCSNGVKGKLKYVLEWSVLSFIGRISYGIYIFHFFVPWFTSKVFVRIGYLPWKELGMYGYLLINLLVLLLMAVVSWYFFEKPLNDLKKHFPYVSQTKINTSTFSWFLRPYMRFVEKNRLR